jgi:phosphoribosyl-ATP pyrophosphohydrolase
MNDTLERLFASVLAAKEQDSSISRTSKLFRDGAKKMAKKLIEEAFEVGLDAVQRNRESTILESADLLYHLAVVWADCGVTPADVMNEINRRERVYGIAEKLPKRAGAAQARRLIAPASGAKPSS